MIKLKKILIIVLIILFVFDVPLSHAEEALPTPDDASQNIDAIEEEGTYSLTAEAYEEPSDDAEKIDPFSLYVGAIGGITEDNNNDTINPNSIFDGGKFGQARIILNSDDLSAVRSLKCLGESDLMIDFDNDFLNFLHFIPSDLPTELLPKPETEEDLLKMKFESPQTFAQYKTVARAQWGEVNGANFASSLSLMKCMDNTIEDLASLDPQYVNDIVSDMKSSLVVDIRTLKTINYLVTPKNQGGAGHYRIRVNRIRAGYTAKSEKMRQTRESDAIYSQMQGVTFGTNSANLSGQTAAEIGMSREIEPANSNGSLATVEDENGDEYDAYMSSQKESEKNISAHADGKAIDISEIDDIRCTLIKKRRIGKTSKSKSTQRPIKLAWQTKEGFTASGGQTEMQQDLMQVFRTAAQDSLTELLGQFDTDVSTYDGDLSKASFEDLTQIMGKSLLAEILNSPGSNLSGYDVSSTMEKLGSMYIADYLGMPRELFTGKNINTLEHFETAIGEAAVSQKLGLPIGTFSANNLEAMLIGVGQRKIEYEMGLDSGDLLGIFNTSPLPVNENITINDKGTITYVSPVLATAVGKAVIEKNLSLKKGSFAGKNFGDLKKNLGKYKADLIFADPTYADNMLHLPKGTTKKLKSGGTSPTEYARLIGQVRMDDTAYGLRYFAATDAAYNLPRNIWDGALVGNTESLKTIGTKSLSHAFSEEDEQRQALELWIASNTTKRNISDCIIPEKIEQAITVTNADNTTSAKVVRISQERALSIGLEEGDLFSILGCSVTNGEAIFQRLGSKILFYAFSNYALNPGSKLTIDISNTDPQLHTSNSTINFYVQRIERIQTLTKRVKNNWKEIQGNAKYDYINSSLSNVISILDSPSAFTDKEEIQRTVRKIKIETEYLNTQFKEQAEVNTALVIKINDTMIDMSELIRLCTEILSGKEIATSDSLTFNTIPEGIFNTSSGSSNSNTQISSKTNKTALMLLLSRKIKPKDFLLQLGTSRTESSLDLPTNSLSYFVQNFESKGVSGADAFYQAIGQAKIEQEFGMPSYYFQGPIMKTDLQMPDFANDLTSLLRYTEQSDDSNDQIKLLDNNQDIFKLNPFGSNTPSSNSTTNISLNLGYTKPLEQYTLPNYFAQHTNQVFALSDMKKTNPEAFKALVRRAEDEYRQEMQTIVNLAGGNEAFESNLEDVVRNIDYYNLSDGIRSPEHDLLFRMGMPVDSLDALNNPSNIAAWNQAEATAESIDRKLLLKPGTTKSLFTGEALSAGNGKNALTSKEKKELAGKLKISVTAIEKFLQVLNGEISVEEINKPLIDIFFTGQNPYIEQPESTDGTVCPNIFEIKDGLDVAENLMVQGKYLYVDADGPKSFESREAAQQYAEEHASKQISYLAQIAKGLSKAFSSTDAQMQNTLTSVVSGSQNVKFTFANEDEKKQWETANGISADLIERFLSKSSITKIKEPLQAYKKAVGQQEAKQKLTWKLFGALGININPDVFGPDDLYSLLVGDYEVLYRIGSSVIDKKFDIPFGTTYSILNSKTANLRKCAISQAGGQMLGAQLGLNNINLKGNILHNLGQSKIEETLNLPRNSFKGDDLDQTINTVLPINFALAFKIPVSKVDFSGVLGNIYKGKELETIKSFTAKTQLEKIQEYLKINAYISQEMNELVKALNNELTATIKSYLNPDAPYWAVDYVITEKKEYGNELRAMISNASQLDSTFYLKAGTTKNFLSQKVTHVCKEVKGEVNVGEKPNVHKESSLVLSCIPKTMSPNDYRDIVGDRTAILFAVIKGLDALNIEGYKAEAMIDFLTNYKFWVAQGRYGDMYNAFANFYQLNFDEKAGFTPGTVASILNNPSQASTLLIGQGIYKLDTKLGLNPADNNSFSSVYAGYLTDNQTCKTSYLLTPQQEVDLLNQEEEAWFNIDYGDNTEASFTTLDTINTTRQASNLNYHDCVKEARKEASEGAIEKAQILIADKLSDKIFEITDGTLAMPAEDIIELTLNGDMRYFNVALMSYGVNRYLENDTDYATIDPALRVSYSDLKLAFIPDSSALEYAADAATYNMLSDDPTEIDYEKSFVTHRYGDVCADKNDFTCITSASFSPQAGLPRAYDNLIAGNNKTFDIIYNYSADKATMTRAAWEKLKTDFMACATTNQGGSDCKRKEDLLKDVQEARNEATSSAKKLFREDLQFRLMDTALWKYDHNVFPGFAYALMKGDGKTKNQAIGTYIRNGLISGQFFNQDIKALQKISNIVEWGAILQFGINYSSADTAEAKLTTFADFAAGDGLNFLTGYMANRSEDWFGFHFDANVATGLVVSTFSGEWGFGGGVSAPGDNNTTTIGGKELVTFGGAVKDVFMTKAFAWADKQLGLDPGTALLYFNYGKRIYEAATTYRQINNIAAGGSISQNTSGAKAIYSYQNRNVTPTPGTDEVAGPQNIDASPENVTGAKAVTKEVIVNIGIAIASQKITDYINKAFGKQIAAFETALGLVPGSTSILIGAGVSYGLMAAAHSFGWLVSAPNPATLLIALGMFVLVNLFGVYKVELKCSADGYYPEMESPPSENVTDVTGLGVWDGINPATMQQKMIEAAKYKSKRLVGDIIYMQNNPVYKNVIPSQIMTGRQEDVDFWNSAVSNQICDKIGLTAIGGVCGGDTRAGIWQNPQTVAWTHIGF